VSVIWHDLECGAYAADMALWRGLADERGDPVLDVGAGTGRITLDLARRGHRVTALDRDPVLIAELERRATGLDVTTEIADARAFALAERFPLIIVPMQTIQLLGGERGRLEFLACARRHLAPPDGVVAIAISEMLELYNVDDALAVPIPDIRELDGIVYSSQPTAVREEADGFVLERLRETVSLDGACTSEQDVIHLDRLTAATLEAEAAEVGLDPYGRHEIPPTTDHVGSVVVMLRG
jgi:SAM-dependent methyltransferase